MALAEPTAVVLRALGLGDLLTAVPALRGVRRAFDGRVLLCAPGALAPLARLSGAVDEVVDTAPLAAVPVHAADLAVNLHGSGPQSTRLLRASGPGRLVAYGVTSAWREDEHERERWARLVTEAGMPADPDDLDLAAPDVAPLAAGAVLVHPGAAYGCRRWPAPRWAVVARRLARRGERVLVTGSAAEVPLARQVAAEAGLPDDAAVAGRTGLLELAALVAAARLVLSGDTGTAHRATAYARPSVVLFGPAPPARWRPPACRSQHQVLWSGRTGPLFADEPDPGLLETAPDDVLSAAEAALVAGSAPARPGSRQTARSASAAGR